MRQLHAPDKNSIFTLGKDVVSEILFLLALSDLVALMVTCRFAYRHIKEPRMLEMLASRLLGCDLCTWRALPKTGNLVIDVRRCWVRQCMSGHKLLYCEEGESRRRIATGFSIEFSPVTLKIGIRSPSRFEDVTDFYFGDVSSWKQTTAYLFQLLNTRPDRLPNRFCYACEGDHLSMTIHLGREFFARRILPVPTLSRRSIAGANNLLVHVICCVECATRCSDGYCMNLCYFRSLFDARKPVNVIVA